MSSGFVLSDVSLLFHSLLHNLRAVCVPTFSWKMWGNIVVFEMLNYRLRYSREKEFYKIGEIDVSQNRSKKNSLS